jgi:hypothetical protein
MRLSLRIVGWCAPLLAMLLMVPWPAAAQKSPLRFLGELGISDKSVEVDETTSAACRAWRTTHGATCTTPSATIAATP